MNILVIGCGKVGSNFAQAMTADDHDVVVVENDKKKLELLDSEFKGLIIQGVPIDEDVLRHAGIENADALAAVTDDDNINIMVCQIAKEIYHVPKIISRIFDPSRARIFHQFGFDTLCPTSMTVNEIRTMMLEPDGITTHSIGNTIIDFVEIKVHKNDVGLKLIDFEVEEGRVFALIKGDRFYFAADDVTLDRGDIVIVSKKAKHNR